MPNLCHNYGILRHFCKNNVCPDPVWKPVSGAARRLTRRGRGWEGWVIFVVFSRRDSLTTFQGMGSLSSVSWWWEGWVVFCLGFQFCLHALPELRQNSVGNSREFCQNSTHNFCSNHVWTSTQSWTHAAGRTKSLVVTGVVVVVVVITMIIIITISITIITISSSSSAICILTVTILLLSLQPVLLWLSLIPSIGAITS